MKLFWKILLLVVSFEIVALFAFMAIKEYVRLNSKFVETETAEILNRTAKEQLKIVELQREYWSRK